MKKITLYLMLISSLGFLQGIAQPSNDDCANAINIPDVNNFCSALGAGTTMNATDDAFTGVSYTMASCQNNGVEDVWYSFVATKTDVMISIIGNTSGGTAGGTLNNPEVVLYEGSCGGTIAELGCASDTAGEDLVEIYEGGLSVGEIYLIRVDGRNNPGTFQVCINNYNPPADPQSDCPTAVVLCDKSGFAVPIISGAGSDIFEMDDADCFGFGFGHETNSTWYVFTAANNGDLTFDLTPTNPNDDLDFVVYELPNGVGDCEGKTILRCMASGDLSSSNSPCMGATGLATGFTDISEEPGCDPGNDNYLAPLDMTTGTTYAIGINNFTSTGNGFSIDFGGTGEFSSVIIDNLITDSPTCNLNNGNIVVQASGGVPPYGFSIDGGVNYQASPTFQSLPPNTYSIIVLDAVGCTASESISINNTGATTINDVLLVNPSCGNSLGSLLISVNGGTSPYEYSVNNGITFQPYNFFQNLSAGTYNVIARDVNGCSDNGTATILNQPEATISGVAVTDPTCGNMNGSLVIMAAGNGPLQYSIDGATFVASPTFNNLANGNYTVYVLDANGCTTTSTASLNGIPAPTITTTVVQPSCNENNGSIDVLVSGGTPGLQFSLNGGTYQPSPTFQNLSPDTYEVIVSDGNGCTGFASVVLNISIAPSISSVKSNPTTCNFNNGSLEIFAGGGTPPLEFSINNGISYQANNVFTGLTSGTYYIVVQDANGCQAEFQEDVLFTNGLQIDFLTPTHPTCGDTNGSITLALGIGSPPYQYSIDGTNYQSSNVFSGLGSGLYTVTAQDNIGCRDTASINLNVTSAVIIDTVMINNGSCGENGFIEINASSGVLNYQYSIDGGSTFQASSVFTNVPSGSHNVLVMDAVGCTASKSISINNAGTTTINNILVVNPSCGTSLGSLLISVNGGTSPYAYSIDNGISFQPYNFFQNLLAGTYNVIVKDLNGCFGTSQVTLIDNGAAVINSILLTQPTCDSDNGKIEINVSGGSPPHQYSIDSGTTFQSTNNFLGLPSGSYNIVVEDASGCMALSSVFLYEAGSPTIDQVSIAPAACGETNGILDIDAIGGTSPYQYSIDGGITFQGLGLFPNLPSGTYQVVVKDLAGCEDSSQVLIPNYDLALIDSISTIHPISCETPYGSLQVFTGSGVYPFTFSIDDGLSFQEDSIFINLEANTYTLLVVDNIGCTATSSIQINNPPPITGIPLYMSEPLTDTDSCSNVARSFIINNYDPNVILVGYSFFKNAILVQNGISKTYTTSDAVNGDLITGEAYDNNGCTYAVAYSVTVNAYPQPEIITCTPTVDSLQITLSQGIPPWSFDFLSYDETDLFSTNNITVYTNDTTLAIAPNRSYELQNLNLINTGCIYNDTIPTNSIQGCSAICTGYSNSYTETYTASFVNAVTAIEWEIIPPTAVNNGDVTLVSGQNSTELEIDFSNPSPVNQQITLVATATTSCGIEKSRYHIKLDTACVWPGDVNNDGQVNNNSNIDYINDEIALVRAQEDYLAYLNNGNQDTLCNFIRTSGCIANANEDWEPQSAIDWDFKKSNGTSYPANFDLSDSLNVFDSVNLKYADCNGDSDIDFDQEWSQTFNTPFSSVAEPTDHDIVVYHAITQRSHNGNAPANKVQNDFSESLHIVASQDTLTNGDEVVFSVYLGDDSDTLKGVHHISFVGEGEFGTYNQPSISVLNSHLSPQNSSKLVDYPFLHPDYNGVENDSLRWYASLGRPENLSHGIDFSGEEVCKLVCHIIVAGLNDNVPNTNANKTTPTLVPVTLRIPAAGLILENNKVIYVKSRIDTIWVRPNPTLNAHLFLEGPFNPSKLLMKDDLRRKGLIPASEPFSDLGFNFPFFDMRGLRMTDSMAVLSVTGQDAIVDWVFIEIRDKNDPSITVTTRPALLTRHGDVVDMDGKSKPKLWHLSQGEYYVVIKTRNHLAAMTAQPVLLNNDYSLINFIQSETYGNGTKALPSGLFVLYAGDADGNNGIDAMDRSCTWNNRNITGYHTADCNMDGVVDASDRSAPWNNRNTVTTVP